MDQISEFFSNLFNTSDWPPRWICGTWSEFHGWLYIMSDVSIWLAYFIIPVIILWFVQKRPDIPFLSFYWLFSAFIIFCGATHIMDAIIFWWPAYRLSALIRFITAIVSVLTVFALIKDLPTFLSLRSPESLNEEKDQREDAEEKISDLENELFMLRQILSEKEKSILKLTDQISGHNSNY
ncbi:hypothetical protein HZR84_10360 [Hyphobacterium sp. CCMP332]|nr:hypothetical protein HZR84_10360 [Hyphobacterium sp. CCMP332]